jgi:hypothetical protein
MVEGESEGERERVSFHQWGRLWYPKYNNKRKREKVSKTIKELAVEIGIDEKYFQNNFLMLDDRYAVMQDEKGLHLTDVLSWASFRPIKIGRKSNATVKGLQFQLGQYKVYIKQIQQAKGA